MWISSNNQIDLIWKYLQVEKKWGWALPSWAKRRPKKTFPVLYLYTPNKNDLWDNLFLHWAQQLGNALKPQSAFCRWKPPANNANVGMKPYIKGEQRWDGKMSILYLICSLKCLMVSHQSTFKCFSFVFVLYSLTQVKDGLVFH